MDDLDSAAKANLDEYDLLRYYEYKEELIGDGESDKEINLILRGFIWNCIECYPE